MSNQIPWCECPPNSTDVIDCHARYYHTTRANASLAYGPCLCICHRIPKAKLPENAQSISAKAARDRKKARTA